MKYSRRMFVKAGVLAAACAGLPLKSVLAQNGQDVPKLRQPALQTQTLPPSSSSLEQLNYYTRSTFSPYVNTIFRVHLEASSARDLKLIEVSDYLSSLSKGNARAKEDGTECFSLLFTLPPGKSFEQDTYMIEHDALGTFYMFLVAVSGHSKVKADYYEAVIYRRLQFEGRLFTDLVTAIEKPVTRIPRGSVEGVPVPVPVRLPAYNFEGKEIEGPVMRPPLRRRTNKFEREDLN